MTKAEDGNASSLPRHLRERLAAQDALRERLTVKKDGTPKATKGNIIEILCRDPKWKGRLRYNAFADQVLLDGVELQDVDETTNAVELEWDWGLDVSSRLLHECMVKVAFDSPFHPVREYLHGLEWDGIVRLPSFFSRYFGAEDAPPVPAMGAKFMVGAVARVMRPGCKLDTMVVLYGGQGAGKSRALAALVPQVEWTADTPFNIRSKDAAIVSQGVWIFEMAELQSLKGRQAATVKAFLSSPRDRLRPPYGRNAVLLPRQCVYVGTTNEEEFIADPTGSRRFWPIRTSSIDHQAILRDRDHLWAEAKTRYERGERWWLTDEEEEQLVVLSEPHREVDSWEDHIIRWAQQMDEPFTMAEILFGALGIPASETNKSKERRVGTILRRLGFGKRQISIGGFKSRYWHRPTVPESDQGEGTGETMG